jgi:hypothetical protein
VLVSAEYRDGRCLVGLRDVMSGFAIDLRRPSRVAYVLVNRARRQALIVGTRAYSSSAYPVFGRETFVLLGEHVTVTRRTLVFEVPRGAPDSVGPDWLKDSVIVPLQIRDIGQFTVRAKVRQDESTQ